MSSFQDFSSMDAFLKELKAAAPSGESPHKGNTLKHTQGVEFDEEPFKPAFILGGSKLWRGYTVAGVPRPMEGETRHTTEQGHCVECRNLGFLRRQLCNPCYQSAQKRGELYKYPTAIQARDLEKLAKLN
jgi:hypothetical protein